MVVKENKTTFNKAAFNLGNGQGDPSSNPGRV